MNVYGVFAEFKLLFLLRSDDKNGYCTTCGQLSSQIGSVMAEPGVMVHPVKGYSAGLYRSPVTETFGA